MSGRPLTRLRSNTVSCASPSSKDHTFESLKALAERKVAQTPPVKSKKVCRFNSFVMHVDQFKYLKLHVYILFKSLIVIFLSLVVLLKQCCV